MTTGAQATRRRLSVNLPQAADTVGPDAALFARRAEALDFWRLWSFDQALPGRMPGVLDGLHALTFAAGCTQHIRLAIGVIALPQRNPVLLAKELASIDLLSHGRLTVGVGLGLRYPDDRRAGVLAGRRSIRFEEGIAVLRALWSGATDVAPGTYFDIAGLRVGPLPAHDGGPALWIGGGVAPALERAARIADGWIAAGGTGPAEFAQQVQCLRAMLDRHGRDQARFPCAKRVFIAVDDDVQRAERRLDRALAELYGQPGVAPASAVYGGVERCAEQIDQLFSSGAEEIVLHPLFEPVEQLDALHAITSLVGAPS